MESDQAAAQSLPLQVLCITDGRAGNRAQALGLAEALDRQLGAVIEERNLALKPWAALLPAASWHWAARHLPGWPAVGLSDAAAALAPVPGGRDALVIGAGRRAAPVVAALAARDGTTSVQLLAPQMDVGAFGLVAAPSHDGLAGSNVVATLGSVGRLTSAGIEASAAAQAGRFDHLPAPRLAVLLGGSSDSARWGPADEDGFVAACAALAGAGWSLIVTPSRRSDPVVIEGIRADCPAERTWIWDGTGENPYPAMLGAAEAVLVTEDSVNMASEAAASALPVHVFRVSGTTAKLRDFHAALAAHGASRPFEGTIGRWTYEPLAEADRLAAIVADRLLHR